MTAELPVPARTDPFLVLPIGEPVVLGGPFVMNAEAEIADAFADFRRGAFGDVPTTMRL
jgi:redox-sensitive bicupin YhaK (pirin superfamily)